ncbi:unnamed protein product, partial [Polarella glacialis]
MSSYYTGSRRFALGGKGWTVVLGSLVSLSYVRAKAGYDHEDKSQAHHKLEDRKGNPVRFADQPDVPGKQEDIVLRIWRELPEVPLPNLYVAGSLLTAIWAYRMWGAFNKLMVIRFADINYQLKRPDVLANKVVALKYLALPLAIVPAGLFLSYGLLSFAALGQDAQEAGEASLISSFLRRQALAMRHMMEEPCREARRVAHDTVDPLAS